MAYHVRLSDLAGMTRDEQNRVLTELNREIDTPRNGQGAVLDARIRELERLYEMSSREMCERLERGELRETADVARWLYLLDARDNRVRA
jgi:hypothetical protein